MSVKLHAHGLQAVYFFHERKWVKHHTVADDGFAAFAQHTAGNELQDKLFALDDDGVSSIVSAGVARDAIKILREHVNDLALTLIAPLGADNDYCVAFFHATSMAQPLRAARISEIVHTSP